MKLRSITVFAEIEVEVNVQRIHALGDAVKAARDRFECAGYEVQTVRLATRCLPALAGSKWRDHPEDWCARYERVCQEAGFGYISLGPAEPEYCAHIPAMLRATESVFATVHVLEPQTCVIDGQAVREAAAVILECAHIADGFGNLRFGALANVPPGVPFFPAAYHGGGPARFAIATEAADLAVDACAQAADAQEAHQRLVGSIEEHASRLAPVAHAFAAEQGLPFGGFDFSLAPFPAPEVSIGAALERLSGAPLGGAGTLAAAAVLTDAIQRADLAHTGFCGLMLPVLEDSTIAQRSAEGRLNVGELLQWSAVCGTGLDTVPVPGDVSPAALERLLYDVAALSARLNKPLTARLMPLPGKRAGDAVHFDFAFFADGGVLPLPASVNGGLLTGCDGLSLAPRRPTQ